VKFKNLPSRKEILADDPLREYFVWWMDHTRRDCDDLRFCLESAERESDLQSFLQERPIVLVQHLGGGHGRWVIPQQRLGAEHVTDFLIGERHSDGFDWQAVELESPAARMFTKAGDPTRALTHAIRQIQDWRAWLLRNQNYASRAKTEGGLGLTDIRPDLPGLILIGRRKENFASTLELRRQMARESNIKIHSYDFLLDNAVGAIWDDLREIEHQSEYHGGESRSRSPATRPHG
jgi:Domain of unknown function (DUF4263)